MKNKFDEKLETANKQKNESLLQSLPKLNYNAHRLVRER